MVRGMSWLTPAPETVSVSVPEHGVTFGVQALVAVTIVIICPVESVLPLEETRLLPFCDVTVSVAPGITVLDESCTVKVSVLEALRAKDVLPKYEIFVPVTAILPDGEVCESAVAITLSKRFDLFVPRLICAVTCPLTLDVPLILLT